MFSMHGVFGRLAILIVIALTLTGQTAPPPTSPVPSPAPQPLSSTSETGPLGDLAEVAFNIGFTGPLAGKLCTALGITTKNEPFPVVQIATGKGSDRRSLNASLHRKRLDLVLSRTLNDEITTFLTSGKGELEKAVVDRRGETREMPLAEAKVPFEAEKSWWLNIWLKNYQARLKTHKR